MRVWNPWKKDEQMSWGEMRREELYPFQYWRTWSRWDSMSGSWFKHRFSIQAIIGTCRISRDHGRRYCCDSWFHWAHRRAWLFNNFVGFVTDRLTENERVHLIDENTRILETYNLFCFCLAISIHDGVGLGSSVATLLFADKWIPPTVFRRLKGWAMEGVSNDFFVATLSDAIGSSVTGVSRSGRTWRTGARFFNWLKTFSNSLTDDFSVSLAETCILIGRRRLGTDKPWSAAFTGRFATESSSTDTISVVGWRLNKSKLS